MILCGVEFLFGFSVRAIGFKLAAYACFESATAERSTVVRARGVGARGRTSCVEHDNAGASSLASQA